MGAIFPLGARSCEAKALLLEREEHSSIAQGIGLNGL